MRSSDEVRDYVYAQQEEIHRKRARLAQQERDLMAATDAEIDQAVQATAAMDNAPPTPCEHRWVYEQAFYTTTNGMAWRHRQMVCPRCTASRELTTFEREHYAAAEMSAADARGLIRALANPWLWLITLTLWGVLIGAGWLVWRVIA